MVEGQRKGFSFKNRLNEVLELLILQRHSNLKLTLLVVNIISSNN